MSGCQSGATDMDNLPLISIVVPTYQRPEKLGRALSSIAAACSHAKEVIVVDDCPQGSGFAAAQSASARYLFKAGVDRGLSHSRNLGLAMARGKYVAFLDDDDYFAPGALDRLLAQGRSDSAVVFGDYITFNEESQTLHPLNHVTLDHMLVNNHIPVGAYVAERSLLRRNFDPHLRSHEDWEFLIANISSGGMCHVPGAVAYIDKTDNATTSMQARRRQQFWLDYISIYARFPAPHLADPRAQSLLTKGINIAPELLKFGDVI